MQSCGGSLGACSVSWKTIWSRFLAVAQGKHGTLFNPKIGAWFFALAERRSNLDFSSVSQSRTTSASFLVLLTSVLHMPCVWGQNPIGFTSRYGATTKKWRYGHHAFPNCTSASNTSTTKITKRKDVRFERWRKLKAPIIAIIRIRKCYMPFLIKRVKRDFELTAWAGVGNQHN